MDMRSNSKFHVKSFIFQHNFVLSDLKILSDPDGTYHLEENSNLVEQKRTYDDRKYIVQGYYPFIPNIRDGNGLLIMPHEYETKLQDEMVVIVNVQPRVYVPPHYDILLNSMQILPITNIFQIIQNQTHNPS